MGRGHNQDLIEFRGWKEVGPMGFAFPIGQGMQHSRTSLNSEVIE